MPTSSQRAILGGAGALSAYFKGRIAALQARQSFFASQREAEMEERKLDINKIFADAQMLSAQTQADKAEAEENDPIAQLKRQIAQPILDKVNAVGVKGLDERELEIYYGLAGIKQKVPDIPEPKSLEELIGLWTAKAIDDETFLKGVDMYEAAASVGSERNALLFAALRAHPGERSETRPKRTFGSDIVEYETLPVKMNLKDIFKEATEEVDRQFSEGHPGQLSRKYREMIEGNYDPEADAIEEQIQGQIDALMANPVTASWLERYNAGTTDEE